MRLAVEVQNTRNENAIMGMERIQYNNAFLPSEPLTLQDIIDVALESNLEMQAKAMEYAYEIWLLTGAKLKMIPQPLVSGRIKLAK